MGVLRAAVGREALDPCIGEAGGQQPLADAIGGGPEGGGALHAMEARQLADGLQRGQAVDVRLDGLRHRVGPERDAPALFGAADRGEGG